MGPLTIYGWVFLFVLLATGIVTGILQYVFDRGDTFDKQHPIWSTLLLTVVIMVLGFLISMYIVELPYSCSTKYGIVDKYSIRTPIISIADSTQTSSNGVFIIAFGSYSSKNELVVKYATVEEHGVQIHSVQCCYSETYFKEVDQGDYYVEEHYTVKSGLFINVHDTNLHYRVFAVPKCSIVRKFEIDMQ